MQFSGPQRYRTDDLCGRSLEARIAAFRQAVVFRDLLEEDLYPLAQIAERRVYSRATLIECPSGGDDAIYVVIRGEVRVFLLSPEGRELTLFTRKGGEVYEVAGVREELASEALSQAMVEGTVVYAIPWPHFLEIVALRPGAVGSLASLLREGLLQERRLISELAFYNMRSRLARKLVDLAEADNQGLVSRSREELASLVGTRPEEVSRALRHLLEEGLVFYRPHGRTIAVVDREALLSY
jgi:CRP-like cAMP-binding protein